MMMCGPGAWRDFTPLRLTPGGFQCDAWYDPSDPATTFQDSAGTTLAVNDGDPVGLLLDKSGRGRNASQATSGKRPTLKIVSSVRFLRFDGTDDELSVSVPKGPSWYAAMAYQKAASGGNAVFLSQTANSSQSVVRDSSTSRLQTFRGTGTSAGQIYEKTTGGGRITWGVLGGLCNGDASSNIRLNKTDQGALTTSGGAFTPATTWNVIGRLSSTFCAFDFGGGYILPRAPSTEEMDILDTWLMARVGL